MNTITEDMLAYRLTSAKPFDIVVANLERLTPERQFRVLAVHDVQKTLAEKGFAYGPLKIIEVCNARYAHQALTQTVDVSLFMPCRFCVYTEAGKTVVALAKPTMMAEMLPDAGLKEVSTQVERELLSIMQAAV
ncbi:MAG TPA: DUF302 domain-containing protein [Candidatus Deferrimicrobium sp.]|nr:DUF302 domain-containing protein [Candidatus Deferrimicrobium sp.]